MWRELHAPAGQRPIDGVIRGQLGKVEIAHDHVGRERVAALAAQVGPAGDRESLERAAVHRDLAAVAEVGVAVTGNGNYDLEIWRDQMPDSLEVRMWQQLRKSGIPRGRVEKFRCSLEGSTERCLLLPRNNGGEFGWRAELDFESKGKEHWISAYARWRDR